MPRDPFRLVLQVPGFGQTLLRKPRLVSSVLRQRALARTRRGPTLTALEYATTYACQASCGHCSATTLAPEGGERDRLSLAELRELAAQAFELGAYEVSFTGGEPTLRKDLEDVIACFAPERTFIGVNTNGALLDGARVRSLRDAGVDLLKLSLDSEDAAEHDANRGLPGNWQHVVDTLRSLRSERGIRGHICSVGTPALIRRGGAAALIRLAEELDATIGFTLPAAVGRWTGHRDVALGAEDARHLSELCRHPRAFFQGSLGSGAFVCPAGRSELYVDPWGRVLPCPYLQQGFGSLRRRSLEQVWASLAGATARAGDEALCRAAGVTA